MKTILAILILAMCCGCATYQVRFEGTDQSGYYPAMREDCRAISYFGDQSWDGLFATLFAPCIILDMPFSIVSDTILLPCDLVRGIARTSQAGTARD